MQDTNNLNVVKNINWFQLFSSLRHPPPYPTKAVQSSLHICWRNQFTNVLMHTLAHISDTEPHDITVSVFHKSDTLP